MEDKVIKIAKEAFDALEERILTSVDEYKNNIGEKINVAYSSAASQMSEEDRKRAGIYIAQKNEELIKTQNQIKAAKRIREQSAVRQTQNISQFAKEGKTIRVSDIENQFDRNFQNDKSRNIAVTYATSTYNKDTDSFFDPKYYYVISGTLEQTVEMMYDFLTNFGKTGPNGEDGASRQNIAKELGFVDENGKAMSMSDIAKIAKIDKKEVVNFLKKFYNGVDTSSRRMKNTVTGKMTRNLKDVSTIRLEDIWRDFESSNTFVVNSTHDQYVIGNQLKKSQEEIQKVVVHDIKRFDWNSRAKEKLSANAQYMPGFTGEVLEAFFTSFNAQAHNAASDVKSEADLLITLDKSIDEAVDFLNSTAEMAINDFTKANGYSPIGPNGFIEQSKDWFRGYMLKRADTIQSKLQNILVQNLSGGLNNGETKKASDQYKLNSGFESFKKEVTSSNRGTDEYFTSKGLGKRLEANIKGIKKNQGTSRVETSAEREFASLFSWANQNGFTIMYEKVGAGDKEKYDFYVVPDGLYNAQDVDATKENSYRFSWAVPDNNGRMESGNIGSATKFFLTNSGKYMDINTWGLSKNISTIMRYGSMKPSDENYKTIEEVNTQLSAQSVGSLQAAPVNYAGQKDYESITWDESTISQSLASREELLRADATMNWAATLEDYFSKNFKAREAAKVWNGGKDFKSWEIPESVFNVFSRYLIERTYNAKTYAESILNGNDEELKEFYTSPEFKKLLTIVDNYFEEGGGYFIQSFSHGSVGTGKALANIDADLPFKDMLPMQSTSSEASSKGKINSTHRKVASYEELLAKKIWKISSLRDNDSKNTGSLVTATMSLPKEILQAAVNLQWGNSKYKEAVTEERLFGDAEFAKSASYYSDVKRNLISDKGLSKEFKNYYNSLNAEIQDINDIAIGQIIKIDPTLNNKTTKNLNLGEHLSVPKGSYILSVERTEEGYKVNYVTETALKQGRKLIDTATNQRREFGYLKIDNVVEAINRSNLPAEEKKILIGQIKDQDIHSFTMDTSDKRSSSMRVQGTFNEGYWEYLVNQIKTKEQFNKIVEKNKAFGARYRWVDGQGVKSNLTQIGGVTQTLQGLDLYNDNSLWEGIDDTLKEYMKYNGVAEEDYKKEIPTYRAAYMANMKKLLLSKDVDINGSKQNVKAFFNSMYEDVYNIMAEENLVPKGMERRLKYIAPNAGTQAEYSGMSGLGYIGNGESKVRISQRFKENIRGRLEKLVYSKQISQSDMDKYLVEFDKLYGGEARDIDKYNSYVASLNNDKLKGRKMFEAVIGNGENKLLNGASLNENEIDISQADFTRQKAGQNISEETYKKSIIGFLYNAVSAAGYQLGVDAQVRLSFNGLDKETQGILNSLGFYDGQVLALGPEEIAKLDAAGAKTYAGGTDRETSDLLRNFNRIVNGEDLEKNYAKRISNNNDNTPRAEAYYRKEVRGKTKSGQDLTKVAIGSKALISANMKVVSLDTSETDQKLLELGNKRADLIGKIQGAKEEEKAALEEQIKALDIEFEKEAQKVSYAVMSKQGVKELFKLGRNPKEKDIRTAFSSIVSDIKTNPVLSADKNLESYSVENFDEKTIEEKKKLYKELIDRYVNALEANDQALPAFFLRNPLLHESNLLQGIKVNNDIAAGKQSNNVIMLPSLAADLLNADFDGDIIQVCQSLITDNIATSRKIFEQIVKNNIRTKAELNTAMRAAFVANNGGSFDSKLYQEHISNLEKEGMSPEEYAQAFLKESTVLVNPQANAAFLAATMHGQGGLGLASYLNTQTQENLKSNRYLKKSIIGDEETSNRYIQDEIFRSIASQMIEQKGISAKKSLGDILKNPEATWDSKNLDKLREAIFNYNGTDEQDALLNAYAVDASEDSKIQYIIQSLLNTFGENKMMMTELFGKNENGSLVLNDGAFSQMLERVRSVNEEARTSWFDYQGAYKNQFTQVNPQMAGTPKTKSGLKFDSYKNEGTEVDKLSMIYEEHSKSVKMAAEAESAKIGISKEVAKALGIENGVVDKLTSGFDSLTQAEKNASEAAEEVSNSIQNESDKGKFLIAKDEDIVPDENYVENHIRRWSQKNGEKTIAFDEKNSDSVTSILKVKEEDEPEIPVWDPRYKAGIKSSATGTYGHRLLELTGIYSKKEGSGISSVEDLLNSNDENIKSEIKKAEEELRNVFGNKLGEQLSSEILEQLQNKAKAVFSAAKEYGIVDENTLYEKTFAGKFSNSERGLSGQADIINDEKGIVADWKFSTDHSKATRDQRIQQASAYMALREEELIAEAEQLEQEANSLSDDDSKKQELIQKAAKLKATAQNYKENGKVEILVSDIDKDGNIIIERIEAKAIESEKIFATLEDKQEYAALKKLNEQYETAIRNGGNKEDLSAKILANKEKMNKILANGLDHTGGSVSYETATSTFYRDGVQVSDDGRGWDNFKGRGASEQTKQINAYLRNLKEQYKVMTDMNRLQASMSTRVEGKDTQNAQALMSVYKQRLEYLKQSQPIVNEQELTEQQLATLQDGRNKVESDYFAKQKQITLAQKQQVGFLSKLVGGFKQQITYLVDMSLAYQAVGKIRQILGEIVQKTIELDSKLVDIQIATGMTRDETKEMLKDYVKLGRELGRTTTDVATAANDWLRAGYEGKEAAELTRASMMLSTLGMIESADATTYLISTLKGWKLGAEDVIGVVDKLTVNFIKKCSVCLVIGIGHKFNCG